MKPVKIKFEYPSVRNCYDGEVKAAIIRKKHSNIRCLDSDTFIV